MEETLTIKKSNTKVKNKYTSHVSVIYFYVQFCRNTVFTLSYVQLLH